VNPISFSNETIVFSANYLDANLNADTAAKIWLTVMNKESNLISKVPFSFNNNRYLVELSNIPSNEYTYNVTVENKTDNISGVFKVLPFEVEQQFTQSDDKALKKLASRTQGTVYYNNPENTLIKNLIADTRFKSIQKVNFVKTPLINITWILGLLIIMLSLEWFIRKYNGKI
jgi:hypothetical protein